ncbi:hypothetical protein BHM03_00062586 [Ensete ventricosum]|nr:hypothetical protein BHM03_00062586 [Ensete ventricosum]
MWSRARCEFHHRSAKVRTMWSGAGQKFARSWPRFKRCCRELAESSPEVCMKFVGSSLTGCRELTRSSLEGCWEFVGSSPKVIGSSSGVQWQDNGSSPVVCREIN